MFNLFYLPIESTTDLQYRRVLINLCVRKFFCLSCSTQMIIVCLLGKINNILKLTGFNFTVFVVTIVMDKSLNTCF